MIPPHWSSDYFLHLLRIVYRRRRSPLMPCWEECCPGSPHTSAIHCGCCQGRSGKAPSRDSTGAEYVRETVVRRLLNAITPLQAHISPRRWRRGSVAMNSHVSCLQASLTDQCSLRYAQLTRSAESRAAASNENIFRFFAKWRGRALP